MKKYNPFRPTDTKHNDPGYKLPISGREKPDLASPSRPVAPAPKPTGAGRIREYNARASVAGNSRGGSGGRAIERAEIAYTTPEGAKKGDTGTPTWDAPQRPMDPQPNKDGKP